MRRRAERRTPADATTASSAIEDRVRAAREQRPLRLLQALARTHDLQMRVADVREHARIRPRDLDERFDIAVLPRAHFDDEHVVPFVRPSSNSLLDADLVVFVCGDASTRSPYASSGATARETPSSSSFPVLPVIGRRPDRERVRARAAGQRHIGLHCVSATTQAPAERRRRGIARRSRSCAAPR